MQKISAIEKAIRNLDDTIKQLELRKMELCALLPEKEKPPTQYQDRKKERLALIKQFGKTISERR